MRRKRQCGDNSQSVDNKMDENDLEIEREGREYAKTKRCILTGLTRQSASTIHKTLMILEEIGSMFQECVIIIYENDSTDGTPEILKRYAARYQSSRCKFIIVSEVLKTEAAISHGGFSKGRFEKMARFRNKILDIVRQNQFENYEFVVNMDLDITEVDVAGVAHSMGLISRSEYWHSKRPDLYGRVGMLSANGTFGDEGRMYDSLAFRSAEFPDTLNQKDQIWRAQKIYTSYSKQGLIPVWSAFSGLAVYWREDLMHCSYGSDDCEHVGLHRCIMDSGKQLFLNPSMRLKYHFN